MAKRSLLERSLGWRQAAPLLTLLFVGLLALATWFAIGAVARLAVTERLGGEARRSTEALTGHAAARVRDALTVGLVAEKVDWIADLARGGAAAPTETDDLLRQLSRDLGSDGFALRRPDGEIVLRWGRLESETALIEELTELQLEEPAAGLMAVDGGAVPVVVVPLEQDFDLLGTVLLTLPPSSAETLAALAAGRAAFVTRAGQELDEAVPLDLPNRAADLLQGINGPTTIEEGGGRWIASLQPTPLVGRDSEKLSASQLVLVHLLRAEEAWKPFRWLQWGAAALGALCVLLAAGLLRLRPGRSAVDKLAGALEALSRGRAARIDGVALEQLGEAGAAFNRLGAAAERRERMERLAAEASSAAAVQALQASAEERSRNVEGILCEETSLLGVEIRRFANPKIAQRAQEDAARASAQLDALAELSAALDGELLFAAGLRAVVSFRGDGGEARAALAACQLRGLFSVPDDPQRDATPPLCVLVRDVVVRGPWRATGSPMTLGPAVQQMQPLLLEAVPGEILATESFFSGLQQSVPELASSTKARRALLTRLSLREVSPGAEADLRRWAEQQGYELGERDRWLGREHSIRHLTDLSATMGVHTLARVGRLGRSGVAGDVLAQPFRAETREGSWLLKLAPADGGELTERWAQETERMKELLPEGLRPPVVHRFAGRPPILQRAWRSGASLRQILSGRRLTPVETAQIAIALGEELARWHRRFMHHGSIKPENVIVDHAGSLSLTDGGLGTGYWLEERGPRDISEVVYAAPEQLRGRGSDARSDLFAVGLVLYEMATGRLPFEGNTLVERIETQSDTTPTSPKIFCTAMSEGLELVVLRCLENRAGQRYQTADELLTDLAGTEEGLLVGGTETAT
ncbi:MAG: protein kinase [Acidobacteriota bacterium]